MASDKEINLKKYVSVLRKYVEPLNSTEQVATQVYFLQFAQMHEENLAKGDYEEMYGMFKQLGEGAFILKLPAMYGQHLIEKLVEAKSTTTKAHYRMALDSLIEFLLSVESSPDQTKN